LELISGEFIRPGLPWWQNAEDKSYNIVINESFAKRLNVKNPIGMSIKYNMGIGKIIGVVRDFNFKPLKEKTAPLFLSFNPESSSILYVKTTGRDMQATLKYLLAKYKEMKPDWSKHPIMYHTVEDEYNKMYADELRTAKVLSVFAVISFFLSLMGVFSMISFIIEKRTKEIAIRKINGAGIIDIIKLFCKDILRIGFAATIIAIPLCYIILQRWLEEYVYRTSLSWWIFLLIPVALISVICFIISIQIWISARRKVVESLRSE
jgi:putative ABC transport system permease protein